MSHRLLGGILLGGVGATILYFLLPKTQQTINQGFQNFEDFLIGGGLPPEQQANVQTGASGGQLIYPNGQVY